MMNEMTEDFLHYVWQHRQYNAFSLKTTSGEPLEILFPGYHNHDAGPDFKQAIVVIDNMKWAGDVEIHLRSSDWYKHQHQKDEKYLSVALHVVYDHDVEVCRRGGEIIPTLELKDRVFEELLCQYHHLVDSLDLLACRNHLQNVSRLTYTALSSTMGMERLLEKQKAVMEMVHLCTEDWNEALYRQLAINFGFHTNAVAFELLSKSLPFNILAKHADSILQISALIFGQAGMLDNSLSDPYYEKLKYEYDYLRYKYQLTPISSAHWNLLRLRPQNFPCLRLAQFSEILHRMPNLFQEFVDNQSADYWQTALSVQPDEYWQTHYHFGKITAKHGVTLGQNAIYLLLINTLVPFLFAFNRFSGNEYLEERAVSILEQLPFENNKLTRIYSRTAFSQNNAMDSQALIELARYYCARKQCLACPVGENIIHHFRKLNQTNNIED